MVENPKPENQGKAPQAPGDAELSARLQHLEQRLGEVRDAKSEIRIPHQTARADNSGLAKAFRLSAEFVSGPVAGGLIGWGVDTLLHSKPWGLIVFLMLGFLAGVYNVMRASGFMKKSDAN